MVNKIKKLLNTASLLGGLFFCLATNQAWADLFVSGMTLTENTFAETGNADVGNVKYDHDFNSWPLGLGAEWRFLDDGEFFFGAGATLFKEIKVKQTTTFYEEDQSPSSFTSRSGLPRISIQDIYFNVYSRSNDILKLFLGVQYTLAKSEASGRFDDYQIENGLGYRAGVEFNLNSNLYSQLFFRYSVLDTEDAGGYEGELDTSALILALGWNFSLINETL